MLHTIAQLCPIWYNENMLSYEISQQQLQRLQALHQQCSRAYAELSNYPEAATSAMHHYALISMVGASTRIENAQLTDSEVEWLDTVLTEDGKITALKQNWQLIENKLSKDRERSIEEVAGCRSMLKLIYEQAQDLLPLTESAVRGLHVELMQYYPPAKRFAGKYKTSSNSVVEYNHNTKESRTVFKTADPGPMTTTAMNDLLGWYNEAREKVQWPIALACEFVYRFLAIHPFQDGNGRLGRGLFLLCLLQCHDEPLRVLSDYLAIDRQIEKYKADYYHVLNRCSKGIYQQNPKKYHIEYFLSYMLKIMEASLKDIKIYKAKFDSLKDLSANALLILNCFKNQPELKLSTKDLCEQTELPRRTVIYSLNALVKHHFIQRYGKGRAVSYQLVF